MLQPVDQIYLLQFYNQHFITVYRYNFNLYIVDYFIAVSFSNVMSSP